MDTVQKPKFGLTNNQLKAIAMASMMLDHIGLLFFPTVAIFRILGRIAFPIFAYMIAEGCRYTKNRTKYLSLIAAMALAFQLVYFVAMGSLYQGILVTFSLAIITIYAIEALCVTFQKLWQPLAAIGALLFVAVFVFVLPKALAGTDFALDYGIWGILIPVVSYFLPIQKWRISNLLTPRQWRMTGVAVLLLIRAIYYTVFPSPLGLIQWGSLLTVPLLFLYNGERGKANMKYVFYIFYPAHLVILYGIAILMMMLK